jgi:hypothetical protein
MPEARRRPHERASASRGNAAPRQRCTPAWARDGTAGAVCSMAARFRASERWHLPVASSFTQPAILMVPPDASPVSRATGSISTEKGRIFPVGRHPLHPAGDMAWPNASCAPRVADEGEDEVALQERGTMARKLVADSRN